MSDLIEIDSLTIDDMRNLAREHDICEDTQDWLDAPQRTVQGVFEEAATNWEYMGDVLKILGGTVNLLPIQDAVIEGRQPWGLFFYAQHVPGADLDRIQDAVVDAGNPFTMRDYARFIPGADKARLRTAAGNVINKV